RMDQPHRNFAKTLLLPQPFPKSAADNQKPYDDVAWSLDYMLGVTVTPVDDPAALGLAGRRLSAVPELPGTVEAGSRWIIEHRGQAALASLRWALPEGAEVLALREPWQGHGVGSLVIAGVGRDQLAAAVEPLHLHAAAIAEAPPTAATVTVNRPRVALFHSWRYTQDSGWLRFTLEQLQIPYTLIDKDDLRQGDLRNQYDLILIPSMGDMSFRDLVHGIDRKWSPLAYTQTAEYPSHGVIDSSPDITGGMGFEGLGNLQTFVEAGGLLLCLGSGGILASEGGLAPDVATARPGGTPGSHLTTKVLRPEHPLVWGVPEVDWVFRGNLPIYSVGEWDRGRTIMQFGTKTWADVEREADGDADIPQDPAPLAALEGEETEAAPKPKQPPLVRSGIVDKAKVIDHHPALLDVPAGKGRVVFYAWNPMHRHQNEHDFAFVTNALLFFDDFPSVPSRDEMRARER
ncbi:MAG: hypothetical protein KC431_03545, partial [Myxococcales bacterium]|nr:hypothetical protein [Myxococcales bacterium]